MKLLWRLSREASRYKGLYLAASLATLALTGVNLAAPRLLSAVTGVVEGGAHEELVARGGRYARMSAIQGDEKIAC